MSDRQSVQSAAMGVAIRRKRRLAALFGAVAACAMSVGAFAPAAKGAIIVTVTDVGHPQVATGTTAAQSNAYEAYLIRLTTNDGGTVSAVDVGSIATRGIFSTSFLQRAQLGFDGDGNPTRTLTPQGTADNSTVTIGDFDTHFLPATGARVDTVAPNEDNDGVNQSNSPADSGASDFGSGTFLKAVFGVSLGSQSTNFALAYLVLPVNATATLTGTAAENGGLLNGTSQNISASIGPAAAVPEPTTLAAAAAVGSAGLLRRRRRLA